MKEFEELKLLKERVKNAEKHFEKNLSQEEVEKALELLNKILLNIVNITEIIESIYGKDCIDWDKVKLKEHEQLSIL